MSSTTTLPNEVALKIMEFCFMDDVSTFINCLRTCGMWYELGRSLPWRDLVIHAKNLVSTVNALASAKPYNLRAIRSISTHFNPNMPPDATQQLFLVYAQLHRMTQLESISSFNILEHSYPGASYAYNAYVQSLLSIPAGVKYLELGGTGLDDGLASNRIHACAVMCSLLPQLQKLRFEQCILCAGLFDVKEICGELDEVYIHGEEGLYKQRCGPDSVPNLQALIRTAKAKIKAGFFPKLTKFMIYGSRRKEEGDGELAFGCLYAIDVLANTTTTYPIAEIEPEIEWVRYQNNATQELRDLVGESLSQDTPLFIEGLTWCQSKLGVRLPWKIKTQREYQLWWDGADFEHLREQYMLHRAETCIPLWYWEERAGRSLIRVQTLPGAKLPDLPEREQPPEELEFLKTRREYEAIESKWF
ncbi:hypothetical protein PMZ80_007756 [Knufia obscura]|uniref:F-box domain-containing protein n=2 Tax=Knufia TaxID=430999 RepID=A0AAN8I8A0_9EURO|nr:hypothetical protein PMZ80_007756 [Knufia obscura]KAK5954291.1 hypothetical protein OHC33_004864 [Knufia fluminis]